MGRKKFSSDSPEKRRKHYIKSSTNVRERLSRLMYAAKTRARTKDLEFNLDLDFLVGLYYKQEESCVLTGIPFILMPPEDKTYHAAPYSPSLDRINPKKGYTKDNIRLLCYHMNIALSEFGTEAFDFLIDNYRLVK